MSKPKTVAEYVAAAPREARASLKELRAILKDAAPEATESLKWGNPVFEEKRILFAYAAYKKHLNFMPTPAVIGALKSECGDFVTGKGSIQLPYDRPLPKALIQKMAALRLQDLRENDARWM